MGQSAEELRDDIERTRSDLGETFDAIGDRVSPGRMIQRRRNRMARGVQAVRDRVMGTADETVHSVAETTREASERAGEMANNAVDDIRSIPDTVRQQSQGNPLVAGAIAFGVGFIVASAVPATRTERKAAAGLTDKAEPLKQQLGDAAHEMVEHLRDPAQQAMQSVKQTAAEGAQHVADAATDAVHDTTDEARRAAADVRTDVTDDTPTGPA